MTTSAQTQTGDSVIEAPDFQTLCEAFQWTVERVPDNLALRDHEGTIELTWREYNERVQRIAAGLTAIGIGRGDTVAMLLTNRVEAMLVDTAAIHVGATPFSIYTTSSPEQVEYLLSHAESRVLVTERAFLGIVEALPKTLPTEHTIVVDGDISLAELEARGDADYDFDAAWRAVTPEDVVVLIYTSGTTGPPKGVELTHANVLATLNSLDQLVPNVYDESLVSYLPMAHIADRIASYYRSLLDGSSVTCVRDPREILSALPVVRPTVFFTVPRMWEKLKAAVESALPVPVTELDGNAKAAIRGRLGMDRVKYLGTGAAPVAPEILTFFSTLGLPIMEAWALSETASAGCINPPHRIKPGTVGPAMPNIEVKVADDGELLLRGPAVMRGYRKDPQKTAEALDADGWFHTGDIGTIDEDGYVTIIDRKKELIINAAGKNMSPANIENTVKSESWLVGPMIAIGDRRPYVTALITLDPDVTAQFAGDVDTEIAAAVARANARLSRVEQIKRYKLLPDPWLPAGDELTPTMKLRRRPIIEKYAAEIEELYA